MTESTAKSAAKGTSRASKPRSARARPAIRRPLPRSVSSRDALSAGGGAPAKAVTWTFLNLPKEASAELPLARHGVGGRHLQWLGLSSHARPGRPRRPLAQSGPEACESRGRGGWRPRLAGDRAGGRGTGTPSAGRSAESSRRRRAESAGGVVGHLAPRPQGLGPVGRVCQAGRDALEADRECLRYARQREATPLLLRSVGDVCQEPRLPRRR